MPFSKAASGVGEGGTILAGMLVWMACLLIVHKPGGIADLPALPLMGTVYCITNLANGKMYVGQTRYPLNIRWRYHVKASRNNSQSALHCAIRKYGTESFKIEPIFVVALADELNEKEKFFIAALNTLSPNGYNLTTGGETCLVSEETRRKISQSLIGHVKNSNTRVSEETRKKISTTFAAKIHCKKGHLLSGKNLYIAPKNGQRLCLTCFYLRSRQQFPQKLLPYLINNSSVNF